MAYPVAMIVENPHAEVKWLDILVGAIQVFFLRPRYCNDLFGLFNGLLLGRRKVGILSLRILPQLRGCC